MEDLIEQALARRDAIAAAADLADDCAFSLGLIAPQLPPFDVPAVATPATLPVGWLPVRSDT